MPGPLPPVERSILLDSSAFIEELGPPSPLSAERAASLVGTLISERYRVDELVGQGGMGAVYRGEQIHLRKQVAIKVLHPDTERLPGLVERFEREAVAGAHVQHPNVAAASDFGKLDDGSYFLVLEYVEGTPLSEVLRAGPFSPARALRIARQMASALAAAHAKGVVHRDIKPHNTLLSPGDQVKIIDFGLAKVDIRSATGKQPARQEVQLTAAGVVMGTPAYLAPEAALGMAAVDARSDLYALGVCLYEMLSGRLPFEENDPAALFRRQRTEDPPPLRSRAPRIAVPVEAERVAMRLIQRNPADRYQTAEDTIRAIDQALGAVGRSARPPTARWALMAAAAAVVPLALLLTLALRTPSPRGDAPSAAPVAAPAPSPSPSLVEPSPASSEPTPVAQPTDTDVAGWRARLDKATQIKGWVLGAKAILALAQLDPAFLDDADTRTRVVAVAAGIAFENRSELADAVFDTLSARLGASGLDTLYDLMVSRGGTRGGQRARAILADPAVVPRETPALRVAFDFFVGNCSARRALLDRAASDGDRRTLVLMEVAHGARCSSKKDPCCFREDPAMADSINRLKTRLKN
jgi:serine/threonine-protein kinase